MPCHRTHHRPILATASLCALTISVPVINAQPSGQGTGGGLARTPGEPIRRGEDLSVFKDLTIELKGWGEHTFESDVDDSDASVSITRAGGQFGIAGPIADKLRWTFETAAESSWYDFTGGETLGLGTDDPVDTVLQITITPGLLYQHSQELSFLGGGIVQFAGETGADVGESATFGGFFGSRWQLSETFALQLGAAVKTRLEDNVGFLPFIGFDWRITETVRLSTRGPGLELEAEVSKEWVFLLTGALQAREYRLEEDDGNAMLDEAIFRDQRAEIGVALEWRPSESAKIRLSTGAVVWSELRFDDSEGIEIVEENADPTVFIGLTGTIRF